MRNRFLRPVSAWEVRLLDLPHVVMLSTTLADAFCLREKGRTFGCLVEALSPLRIVVIKILWCSYKKSQTSNFPGPLKRHVQVLLRRQSQALVDFSPADQLYRNQERWFQGLIYWNIGHCDLCWPNFITLSIRWLLNLGRRNRCLIDVKEGPLEFVLLCRQGNSSNFSLFLHLTFFLCLFPSVGPKTIAFCTIASLPILQLLSPDLRPVSAFLALSVFLS